MFSFPDLLWHVAPAVCTRLGRPLRVNKHYFCTSTLSLVQQQLLEEPPRGIIIRLGIAEARIHLGNLHVLYDDGVVVLHVGGRDLVEEIHPRILHRRIYSRQLPLLLVPIVAPLLLSCEVSLLLFQAFLLLLEESRVFDDPPVTIRQVVARVHVYGDHATPTLSLSLIIGLDTRIPLSTGVLLDDDLLDPTPDVPVHSHRDLPYRRQPQDVKPGVGLDDREA